MQRKCAIAATAIAMMLAPSMAQADSISSVEGARAKERQGTYLNRQDREKLRRYGGNDDYGPVYGGAVYGGPVYSYGSYGYNGYYDDGYGYDGYEPGVGVGIYLGN